MFRWFRPQSSLSSDHRHWIDQSFAWLHKSFGEVPLRSPVVTPSNDFFPDRFEANEHDAEILFNRVCRYMNVDRGRINLRFHSASSHDNGAPLLDSIQISSYAAGTYEKTDDSITIQIENTRLEDAESLVGVMAHELGHVHLLADGRCTIEDQYHEHLTDLLTVYLGFGIFTANSARREETRSIKHWTGWSHWYMGYLPPDAYAYALAIFADTRDEPNPPVWSKYLRQDLRSLLAVELDELRQGSQPEHGAGLARLTERVRAATQGTAPSIIGAVDISLAQPELEQVELQNLLGEDFDDAGETEADKFFAQGVFLSQQGQHQNAIEAFTKSIELNADDAEAWMYRGDLFLHLQRYTKAVGDYTRAEAIDNTLHVARGNRVYCYAWLKRYDDVIAEAAIALREEQQHPLVHYSLAVAHASRNELRPALIALNRAIHCSPARGEFYLARSRVCEQLGLDRQARHDLAKALKHDPKLHQPEGIARTLAAQVLPDLNW